MTIYATLPEIRNAFPKDHIVQIGGRGGRLGSIAGYEGGATLNGDFTWAVRVRDLDSGDIIDVFLPESLELVRR